MTPIGLPLLSHLPAAMSGPHLSAVRLLMSPLLAVPAFTIKLGGRFLSSLLALASLLGLAFAAFAAFALV